MRLKITKEEGMSDYLYSEYSRFIFDNFKSDLSDFVNSNRRKYKLREKLILSSNFIRWKGTPSTINVCQTIIDSVELYKQKGICWIRVNPNSIIPGSRTKVEVLVRLLEFGSGRFTPLPAIRLTISKYSKCQSKYFSKFLRRRYSSNEF